MEHRRRQHRQSANWAGSCHVEGDSALGWRDCRIIDISMVGLGITFQYPWPSKLPGCPISVELPAFGDSVIIRLEGVIRNATPLDGVVRVGIEFVGLSEAEQSITAGLSVMSDTVVAN